jgi:hypothetical protein
VLRLAVLTAVVVSIGIPAQAAELPGPMHRRPTVTAASWAQRADQAIEAAESSDPGPSAFQAAWLASAIAHRKGWEDPQALHYLHEALSQQQPSGGYGLPYAWDAFSDGTVNPASTTYTVSLWQVGDVALEAYQAGAVPESAVSSILDALFAQPRIKTAAGYAVAYSNAMGDVKRGYVTHNVNAAAALLAYKITKAGIYGHHSPAVSADFVRVLVREEEATYVASSHDWRYADYRTRANDASHNAVDITAMMTLSPGIGRSAVKWTMTHALADPTGFAAHAWLAQFDCADSAQWLSEYDAGIASPRFATFNYYTQLARADALAAEACGAHDLGSRRPG